MHRGDRERNAYVISKSNYNCRVVVPTMAIRPVVFQLIEHPADPPKVSCARAKSGQQISASADRTVRGSPGKAIAATLLHVCVIAK